MVLHELQYLSVCRSDCALLPNEPISRFSAGTLGPVVFGLGLRDSCLVIFFFNIICAALPSYLWVQIMYPTCTLRLALHVRSTWGPKLGLRQMCQARYSFGYAIFVSSHWLSVQPWFRYYGVIIPCLLNLIGMCGFCILNCILGGQTLASVSNGNLSWRYRLPTFLMKPSSSQLCLVLG